MVDKGVRLIWRTSTIKNQAASSNLTIFEKIRGVAPVFKEVTKKSSWLPESMKSQERGHQEPARWRLNVNSKLGYST